MTTVIAATSKLPTYDEQHELLLADGYLFREESESGSRYYVKLGGAEVRVSDHRPNGPTALWMKANNVKDIRVSKLVDESEIVGYHENKTHKSRSQLAVALESWRLYEGMFVTEVCEPEDETVPMQIGSFTHQQILEPHLETNIIEIPDDVLSWETKDGKKLKNGAKRGAKWTEFEEANPGKVLLKKKEMNSALGAVQAIRNNLAGYIFSPICEREVEIYWTHHTGLQLRAKLDLLIKGNRHWVIPDIKTTANLDRFPAEIRNRYLWLQASHYRAAVKAQFNKDAVFKFVAVEKSGVFRVRHYELEHDALMEADERYEALLVELASRYESGDWSEDSEKVAAITVNSRQCFKINYDEDQQ